MGAWAEEVDEVEEGQEAVRERQLNREYGGGGAEVRLSLLPEFSLSISTNKSFLFYFLNDLPGKGWFQMRRG